MEQIYNKLVRDKIPEIIRNNGERPIIRILEDNEYKQELEKKLLEVIISLAKLEEKYLDDIIKVADIKRDKRGGFDKKVFLEKVLS